MVDSNNVTNSFGIAEPGGIGEKCIDFYTYFYKYKKKELNIVLVVF